MINLSLGVGLGGVAMGAVSSPLIINGGFDGGTLAPWDDPVGHYSVVSGRAYHAPDAALRKLQQSPFEGITQDYRLTFDCEIISGRLRVQTRNSGGGGTTSLFKPYDTSITSVSQDFTTDSNDVFLMFARNDIDSVTEFYIDNVVLTKI